MFKCFLHPQTTAPDVLVFRANNVPQTAQYNFWSNSFSATLGLHLAAAIGTIEQAREGSCFAPAVRVASDIPTDFLHKVKGLLGAAITLHAIYNLLIAYGGAAQYIAYALPVAVERLSAFRLSQRK